MSFFRRVMRRPTRGEQRAGGSNHSPPPEYEESPSIPDFMDITDQEADQVPGTSERPGALNIHRQDPLFQRANITVCTRIILSNINQEITEKLCLQLLYLIQQKFSGNRFILPTIIYSVGKSLCHLESYGQGSFLGKNNSTLNYNLATKSSIDWFARSNLDFEFSVPGNNFRVALSYDVSPSMFKGHDFPSCIPEWMRPVIRASKSYRVLRDPVQGFYIC